jgi:hypothetical protein
MEIVAIVWAAAILLYCFRALAIVAVALLRNPFVLTVTIGGLILAPLLLILHII